MRKLLLSAAALAVFASPALAHPEHDEMPRRVERKPIAESAKDAVIRLVTQAKLDASWSSVSAEKSEMRMIGGAQRWVVTFRNPAIKVAAKRILYVLLTPNGDFVSADHSLR